MQQNNQPNTVTGDDQATDRNLRKVRFYNIQWDTDGENINLPLDVIEEVPDPLFDIELEGADLLSDKFGWCVDTFDWEVLDSNGDLGQKQQIRLDFHWADGADTSFIGVYETTLEAYEAGELPEQCDFIQFVFGDDIPLGKAIETVVQSAVDAANAAQPKTRTEAVSAAMTYLKTQADDTAQKVFDAFADKAKNFAPM